MDMMEVPPWLLHVERRFGHWGIPHLLKGLVILNCLVFVLQYLQPGFASMLVFDADAIRAGEYWRVLTFLLQPASSFSSLGVLFFALAMWFTWFIADGLEGELGPLLMNLYLLISTVATIVTAFLLGYDYVGPYYILLSFFFAFATFFPEVEILLFFILPIKIKYLALISAILTVIQMVRAPSSIPIILAGLLVYIILFFPQYIRYLRMRADSKRRMKKFRGED